MEGAGEKYVDEKNWSRGRRRVENDLAKVAKVEAGDDTFHSVSLMEAFYHSPHFISFYLILSEVYLIFISFTRGLSYFTVGLYHFPEVYLILPEVYLIYQKFISAKITKPMVLNSFA